MCMIDGENLNKKKKLSKNDLELIEISNKVLEAGYSEIKQELNEIKSLLKEPCFDYIKISESKILN